MDSELLFNNFGILKHVDQDMELLSLLLEAFSSTYNESLSELSKALKAKDIKKAEIVTENLQDALAHFFSESLADCIRMLGSKVQSHELDDAYDYYLELTEKIPLLIQQLVHHFELNFHSN